MGKFLFLDDRDKIDISQERHSSAPRRPVQMSSGKKTSAIYVFLSGMTAPRHFLIYKGSIFDVEVLNSVN